MMDVGDGFFIVKFDLAKDREKVLCSGPWMLFDHYLAVSEWSLDFISLATKVEKTMV